MIVLKTAKSMNNIYIKDSNASTSRCGEERGCNEMVSSNRISKHKDVLRKKQMEKKSKILQLNATDHLHGALFDSFNSSLECSKGACEKDNSVRSEEDKSAEEVGDDSDIIEMFADNSAFKIKYVECEQQTERFNDGMPREREINNNSICEKHEWTKEDKELLISSEDEEINDNVACCVNDEVNTKLNMKFKVQSNKKDFETIIQQNKKFKKYDKSSDGNLNDQRFGDHNSQCDSLNKKSLRHSNKNKRAVGEGESRKVEQCLSAQFVLEPGPISDKVMCLVTRVRKGLPNVVRAATYFLHMRDKKFSDIILLSAKKVIKSSTSHYFIYIHPFTSFSSSCVGSVSSNLTGTNFTVYDNAGRGLKREMAAIIYQTNVFKSPRKMTLVLPGMNKQRQRQEVRPLNKENTLVQRWKENRMDGLVELKNINAKPEDVLKYHMDFHGRIMHPSCKNFQIIHPLDPSFIVMQFGRFSQNCFGMEYSYPLCAMQAFAVVLSIVDGKLFCQ